MPQPRPSHLPPAAPARRARARRGRKPLGQILLEMGAVDPGDLLRAVAMRDRQDLPLGDILLAHGWVAEGDLMTALAAQWGAEALDLIGQRPDPRLMDRLGAETCLRAAVLPWRRVGGATVIATARPDAFQALLPQLTAEFGPCAISLRTSPLCRVATRAA